MMADQIITVPVMVTAQQECRYDSPIDGTPITSWAQRRDDLARSCCRPYDPEMKTDYLNRVKAEEKQFEQAMDATVEEVVTKLPTEKRAQLHSELTEQGHDLTYTRSTKET